jgi:hypothetical protein
MYPFKDLLYLICYPNHMILKDNYFVALLWWWYIPYIHKYKISLFIFITVRIYDVIKAHGNMIYFIILCSYYYYMCEKYHAFFIWYNMIESRLL